MLLLLVGTTLAAGLTSVADESGQYTLVWIPIPNESGLDGLVVTRTAAGTRVAPAAARLPLTVTRQIRELITNAEATGASPDDVIDVLRVMWRTTAHGAPALLNDEGDEDRPLSAALQPSSSNR
ncbi:hypothetical protein [Microbacterium sp.]|uniref:hypothetical protein n=1 Tax=Microbacterium sp. TaxID=51671 RepID=UPI0039E3D2C8